MLEAHEVIIKPVVTEKSTNLMTWNSQYVFIINRKANKIDVRKAVESRWDVKVLDVQIVNKKGKPRRLRMNKRGKLPDWKKAIVKLRPDDAIEVF